MKCLVPVLIAAALALAAGVLLGWAARDFLAVDRCLDAGGMWSGRGYCVGARTE